MEIKDLLAKIAEYDEMEAPDGMNIVEDKVDEVKEEDIKDLANKDEQEAADGMNLLEKETNEDIDQENENAENKRKLRIYKKAYEALEELSNFLEDECVDPMLGDLDEETKAFNNKINELTQEIYSRSLAFEG